MPIRKGVGISRIITPTAVAITDVPAKFKGAVGQTANLAQWLDSDDNVLAQVTRHGKIQSTVGLRGVANQGGDGLSAWAYGEFVAEHSG